MPRKLKRVNAFCSEHPEFTPGQIRWLIFNAERNGLAEAGAIVRLPNARGRITKNAPVFLDEDRFFARLDKLNNPHVAA